MILQSKAILGWATWANEMNVMNHAAGVGSNVRPVDQQSSTLPLCYGCPHKEHGHSVGWLLPCTPFIMMTIMYHAHRTDIVTLSTHRKKWGSHLVLFMRGTDDESRLCWLHPFHVNEFFLLGVQRTLVQHTLHHWHDEITNKNQSCFQPQKWNEWCYKQRFVNILGRGQPGLMRWSLVWIMSKVQDLLLNLLTCSPTHYHCAMAAPGSRHGITN